MPWIPLVVLFALALLIGAVAWLRTHPSPLPYSQRFFVQGAHPLLGRQSLREILDPEPGERMLEIGPGTGYYSLPVAAWISPAGTLAIVDVITEWLDHTVGEAERQGLANIVPTWADAVSLPFEERSFDAALLVQVLGEVPDQEAALRELCRVLKPGGRLVVGESVLDPHVVPLRALQRRAGAAGLRFDRAAGGALGYFARFRPEGASRSVS
jgi:ubiquinone/menaquinone biosynthesis C-methylase UbiE